MSEESIIKKERIAKKLSRHGVASRRMAEEMILQGRIAVNGAVLTTPAFLVGDGDEIMVDGTPLVAKQPVQFYLLHKPRGMITSMSDDRGRACIADILPADKKNLKAIGRLDYNSEGLLLLTNDGEVKRQWEHPSSEIMRGYRVRVFGQPDPAELEKLAGGITIDDFHYRGIKAKIEDKEKINCWLYMELLEGKNREIRRIMEYLGHPVSRLIRVRYGSFILGNMPPGVLRPATDEETSAAIKTMPLPTTMTT
ncbi:MAG: pseudouridine synthase [Hydrotalea sp.]|nr:pseudouridine synthase [Hydrotalea sp.]